MSAQTQQFLDAAWKSFLERAGQKVIDGMAEDPVLADLIANAFKNGVIVGVLNSDAELFDLFHDEAK